MNRKLCVSFFAALAPLLAGPKLAAEEPPSPIAFPREALVLGRVARAGRSPLRRDPVEAQIVAGRWSAPKAGDAVTLPDGTTQAWERVTAGEDGSFQHRALAGGYAYVPIPAEARRVVLLDAGGHGMVYVNNEPRMGDPYNTGAVRLPILLRPGVNHLLFGGGRGRLRARFAVPEAPVLLDAGDATLPDLIAGEKTDAPGAVVIINATEEPAAGLTLEAAWPGGETTRTALPPLLPLGARKVGFSLRGNAPAAAGAEQEIVLTLRRGESREALHTLPIRLRVRRPDQTHKRTFRSDIDGSVQYYAVQPAQPLPGDQTPPALFFSLHGAGVEAIGQADAYSAKTWGHLVAPTNRRPYGFDWEDWGRLDALEVLEIAGRRLGTDPQRTYLTGHSMGGHGVWHPGATFPDRWAAIGPSAGWISFATYGGGGTRSVENPSPVEALLQRARTASDTLALLANYAPYGVYILHGGADDNVPAAQAREMQRLLSPFHRDFTYHEEPGRGHWWDVESTPGAECVDWRPMFDLFARRRNPPPAAVRSVDFTTASPGVSARSHWATIEAQIRQLAPSRVRIDCEPLLRRFTGTTENVARLCLRLDPLPPGGPIQIVLDGQTLAEIPGPRSGARLWLERRGGDRWETISEPSPADKGPHRYGPFKDAFRHRMLLVYGTRGTPEENAWALAKARFDAEQWWVRGNGSVDVLPDRAFDPASDRDRSVILYGNADTNGAWSALLANSPVQVRRGTVRIGERAETGDDLACLFLRPRPGSDRASVAVVAGTGLAGMRLTDRTPYFTAGVAYPDCTVLGPEMLAGGPGVTDAGVRAAGFFGLDWSVTRGEFAYPSPPGPVSHAVEEGE